MGKTGVASPPPVTPYAKPGGEPVTEMASDLLEALCVIVASAKNRVKPGFMFDTGACP